MSSTGTRFDKNKPKVHLIPPIVTLGLAPVYEMGAAKYSDYNWLENPMDWTRMLDSLERHRLAFQSGADFDNGPGGSGLYHTQHLAWNAVGLMSYQLLNIGRDDRFKLYPLDEQKKPPEELG